MRLVDRPRCRPMRCAAIPYIGQAYGEKVWFDTGSELDGRDNHVYLSGTAVKQMAGMLGWVPPGEVKALLREIEALKALLVDAQAETTDLRKRFDAIDVLASQGFRERKKPGRPVKEPA